MAESIPRIKPKFVSFAFQPHLLFDDKTEPGAHITVGPIWHPFDVGERLTLDQTVKLGYEFWSNQHMIDASAGLMLTLKPKNSGDSITVEAGPGYKLFLTNDDSHALIKGGVFLQYDIRYNFRVIDSLDFGISMVFEHNAKNPSDYAIRPGLALQYKIW